MGTYNCYYCPEKPSGFKNIIHHLINSHKREEMHDRQFNGCQIRTIKFRTIPDFCRELGRTITLDEIKETVRILKANVVPKDGPFKKLVKLEGSNSAKNPDDPLNENFFGQDLNGNEEPRDTDLSLPFSPFLPSPSPLSPPAPYHPHHYSVI